LRDKKLPHPFGLSGIRFVRSKNSFAFIYFGFHFADEKYNKINLEDQIGEVFISNGIGLHGYYDHHAAYRSGNRSRDDRSAKKVY